MRKIKSKKKPEMRTLSVRIPRDLYDSLDAFKEELQDFDKTMVLDVNELVTLALRRDLRVAQEELEQLRQIPLKPPPVRQSTVTPDPAPLVADVPVETQRNPDSVQGERPMEQVTSGEQVRPRRVKDLMR